MSHPKIRIFSLALVLIAAVGMASVSFAQAAPCGVPGGPVCTPTPTSRPPRPTDVPTTAPVVQQPAQPTAEPTMTPAPTEAPLIPLPTTGECVAAANGNFRVNVRDWPGEDGDIIDVLSSSEVEPAMAHVKVFSGRDGSVLWIATESGGFMSEAALRFGGEDCDALPEIELPDSGEPFMLASDFDEDGETDAQLIFAAPRRDETSDDDVCIEYPYHDPYGGGGTICLPFDITITSTVCVSGHCIVVDPYGEEYEHEFNLVSATPLPPVDDGIFDTGNLFLSIPGVPEATFNVYHGPFDPDICIDHTVGNPWTGKSMTMCISADVGAGDVYCENGHCVPVYD